MFRRNVAYLMITNSKGSQCFAGNIGRRIRRQLTLFSDGNENNINRRNLSAKGCLPNDYNFKR
ncbi:MAG: hypothetical protein LBP87_13140 [Planctomycetaceae bacterium]|nr:hypothetical protein [Planctomycetaceae bacterium]